MSNPHQVTRDFEKALCEYTGAPYAVAVNSCTMALLLACKWWIEQHKKTELGKKTDILCHLNGGVYRPIISIPKHTYVSVPQSIIHAGGRPVFRDEDWRGLYQLKPLPVWDSARYLSSDMKSMWGDGVVPLSCPYPKGGMVCVSFHASKTLGIEQGGAILHDDPEADKWFRRARFDGRTEGVEPKDDTFDMIGYHCYMNPSTAAQGLLKLASLPKWNEPLPNSDYPDLSLMEIFK